MALLTTTLSGCATDSRDRHLAMRAAALRPESGSGVSLASALPPEGLIAGGVWAAAEYPALTPEH